MSILSAVNITKSYSGVQALKGVTFDVCAGEVHALVGENGAGKSTLIRIITGAVAADGGTIEFEGESIIENSPRYAKSLGIAAIYQQPALFRELTVAENICIALEPPSLWRRIDWTARRRQAAKLLSNLGSDIDPDAIAGDLSMPQQQLVEIARAIGAKAKLLIMDEPTASLSEEETRRLFDLIRRLRDGGTGIIYISHRLEELVLIADRVTVLRDGCSIATRQMSEIAKRELISLMVGRELSSVYPKKSIKIHEPVLELREFGTRDGRVSNVSLSIRAGEIVGLAGLVGAGRTELARAIFGLVLHTTGEILIRGKAVTINSPEEAIENGIAYLPEDRHHHGVIPEMSVSHNISLASIGDLSKISGVDTRRERDLAAEYVGRLGIKTPGLFTPVSKLSGGNQQKVALSRWLATGPSVLILDEPTQGVDVGAKSEIHALMTEVASKGAAILMISSELPEILGMSDRIAVMRNGEIVAALDRERATQEGVLALALGHQTVGAGSSASGDEAEARP